MGHKLMEFEVFNIYMPAFMYIRIINHLSYRLKTYFETQRE